MGFRISTYDILEEHKALEVEEVTIEPVVEPVVNAEPELEDTDLTEEDLWVIASSKLHLGEMEGKIDTDSLSY